MYYSNYPAIVRNDHEKLEAGLRMTNPEPGPQWRGQEQQILCEAAGCQNPRMYRYHDIDLCMEHLRVGNSKDKARLDG